MVTGETHVFVHVERNDVFETDLFLLVKFDKAFVNTDRRGSGGKTKDKGSFTIGCKLSYTFFNIVGYRYAVSNYILYTCSSKTTYQ